MSSRRKMASATGMPAQPARRASEDEPLLGNAGDASQVRGKPLAQNLILGTGILAQAGIWILTGIVWGKVFTHEVMFFSVHPLLNSAGILLITQGALILQPTHTAKQKKTGTYAHATFNDLGIAALIAGLVVIEMNKIAHGGTHFESTHAILGLVTYILMGLQAVVGFTMFFVPQLYGGEAKAKSIWKYHRISGYVTFVLALCTVAAATQTTYNVGVLHIELWAVIVASVITLVGIVPRIKKHKLGF